MMMLKRKKIWFVLKHKKWRHIKFNQIPIFIYETDCEKCLKAENMANLGCFYFDARFKQSKYKVKFINPNTIQISVSGIIVSPCGTNINMLNTVKSCVNC